ncbi:MAG: hypothetical protein KGD74_03685 [Candidatus Lokiarchaeota archaeon]|nr:hypothetical protein [Candidatus Lokiarchaeota archaeon]
MGHRIDNSASFQKRMARFVEYWGWFAKNSSNVMVFLQSLQFRSGEKCAIPVVLKRTILKIDGY